MCLKEKGKWEYELWGGGIDVRRKWLYIKIYVYLVIDFGSCLEMI